MERKLFLSIAFKILMIAITTANIVVDVQYYNVRLNVSETNPEHAPRWQSKAIIVLSSMLLPCYIYAYFVKPVIPKFIRYVFLVFLATFHFSAMIVNVNRDFINTNDPNDDTLECVHTGMLCSSAMAVNALGFLLPMGTVLDACVSCAYRHDERLFKRE